jgi:hypothetical protein
MLPVAVELVELVVLEEALLVALVRLQPAAVSLALSILAPAVAETSLLATQQLWAAKVDLA